MTCNLGGIQFGMCPLITFQDPLHIPGNEHGGGSDAENKFFVLIDDVEVVDEPKGIVRRIGGFIRLKSIDERENFSVYNSCYFSFKSLTPVFIGERVKVENGEIGSAWDF